MQLTLDCNMSGVPVAQGSFHMIPPLFFMTRVHLTLLFAFDNHEFVDLVLVLGEMINVYLMYI